jgi:lipoprotein signal peptidase
MRPLPGTPLARCATVAAGVLAIDLVSKLAAVTLLAGRDVPLAGGAWLTTYYNDTFARGLVLGQWTTAATLALAVLVLALTWRACAPLARHDLLAPVALGLLAGATVGNALDFVRTGRGAVDFLAVPTAEGAIIFNLADVAAYVGVVLLARTAVVLARAVVAERRAPARTLVHVTPAATRQAAREVAVRVPLYVERGVAVATAGTPRTEATERVERAADRRRRREPARATRGAPPESHGTTATPFDQHPSDATGR